MILVDANLLLYAQDTSSLQHAAAKAWWDAALSGSDRLCMCWPVVNAFVRIGTNPRVFARPLTMAEACDSVKGWLERPNVNLIEPTASHWPLFRSLLESTQAIGNLVTDAHLAAIAIEHGCELASSDADFSRFPKLKWFNPLKNSKPSPA